jgi:hypothetical protein
VFFIYLFIYDKLDENLMPNIHKNKALKKGGRERYKVGGSKSKQKERKPPTRVDHKGNKIKSSTQPSPDARSI